MAQHDMAQDDLAQERMATRAGSPQAPIPGGDAASGLTEAEAERRLAQYGENALAEHHVSVFERLPIFSGGRSPG